MNSIEEQLVDSSRVIADVVVANIGINQELFDETVLLVMKDEYPLSMRAARIIQLVAEKHPNMMRVHVQDFINCLKHSKIDGVKRCLLKIFAEAPVYITEDQIGELTDLCFAFAEDQKEAIAIRAFAIDFLLKVMKQFPELKTELKSVLESIIPDGSVGLKHKCRKILKKLYDKVEVKKLY